jgi:hypothetical protein
VVCSTMPYLGLAANSCNLSAAALPVLTCVHFYY